MLGSLSWQDNIDVAVASFLTPQAWSSLVWLVGLKATTFSFVFLHLADNIDIGMERNYTALLFAALHLYLHFFLWLILLKATTVHYYLNTQQHIAVGDWIVAAIMTLRCYSLWYIFPQECALNIFWQCGSVVVLVMTIFLIILLIFDNVAHSTEKVRAMLKLAQLWNRRLVIC